MSGSDGTGDWLRGVLDPCLLALLAEGEAYGYELTARLEARGIGRISGGSLYPALLRLEKHGLLRSDWRAGDGGPGRKYYALTEAGRATLTTQEAEWRRFATAVGRLLRSGVRT